MEAEGKYDDLLVRYLFNETSREEGIFVKDWINADEKNKQYLERLEKTLELIALKTDQNKIHLDEEWFRLQGAIARNPLKVVHHHQHRNRLDEAAKEEKQKRKKGYKIFVYTVVAASVLFAVFLGWNGLRNDNTGQEIGVTGPVIKTDLRTAITQREVNTSGEKRTFTLPDGSEIRLSNNSEITFNKPVNGDKREVILKGEAEFIVAKDKTSPFTVFSGDISTTALGTRFTVTAFETEKYILVKLNEGKVVVKSIKSTGNKITDDFYLLPGQKLLYNKILQTVKIGLFANGKASKAGETGPDKSDKEDPAVPEYDKRSWFMFNNQPLNEIFGALEIMYDVKIVYSKKDMSRRYFIGTFNRTDSIENILKQIASLNNLIIAKKDKTFILRNK